MPDFLIEVVASSVHSCLEAQRGGAHRIELCSALATAGVTPSTGLLRAVKSKVSLPVYVMIRPREGNFIYSDLELHVMQEEIISLKDVGADGFVFGILHENGTVNVEAMKPLVELCKPKEVTFHRAIDITPDISKALEDVIACGCSRVLTSGGMPTGPEGISILQSLQEQAAGRIIIMPGGGIKPETFGAVLNRTIKEYHLSGRVNVISPYQSKLFDMNWAETEASQISKVCSMASAFFTKL